MLVTAISTASTASTVKAVNAATKGRQCLTFFKSTNNAFINRSGSTFTKRLSSSSSSSPLHLHLHLPILSSSYNTPVLQMKIQSSLSTTNPFKHNQVIRNHNNNMCLFSTTTTTTATTATTNNGDNNNNNNNNNDNDNNNNNDANEYNFETDEIIINKTKKWIQNVIIKLNLCPFADKSMKQNKLYTSIVRGNGNGNDSVSNTDDIDTDTDDDIDDDKKDDMETIISSIIYECIKRQDDEGTTVVICPDLALDDFEGQFLDVVEVLNQILDDTNLKDDIQIAPFHPSFIFGSSEVDAIDNFTNRSPYPIFHILREEEVAAAVDKLDGDSSKVFQRNINLLEKMERILGRENTEQVMKGETVDGLFEILRSKDLVMDDDDEDDDDGNGDDDSGRK